MRWLANGACHRGRSRRDLAPASELEQPTNPTISAPTIQTFRITRLLDWHVKPVRRPQKSGPIFPWAAKVAKFGGQTEAQLVRTVSSVMFSEGSAPSNAFLGDRYLGLRYRVDAPAGRGPDAPVWRYQKKPLRCWTKKWPETGAAGVPVCRSPLPARPGRATSAQSTVSTTTRTGHSPSAGR